MKLLTKLNIRYMAYTMIVMVISGLAIYIIFSLIITRQLDERLSGTLQTIEQQLAKTPDTIFFEPQTHILKTRAAPYQAVFSDTLLYNKIEAEFEEYRMIRTIKNIKGTNFSITVTKSKIESEDLLATLGLVIVLAMLLLTAILALVNRRVTQSIWLPFYENLKIIGSFSVREQKEVKLKATSINEFDEMNEVLSTLTRQIISDYRNQKQFSEDISHELQTPLTIISSRLEALFNGQELNPKQVEIANSIYSSVNRLSKLNKALILLSKIENNQFYGNKKTNLKTLLEEKVDEFSELIRLKNLETDTQLTEDFMLNTNPALAGVLINNLLSNSINHTESGGKIIIACTARSISFCNSGNEAIPEPEKLFNRFYKTDPSSGSVGLGLAIVKKICSKLNLDVSYHFSESMHCFTISLNQ